MELSEYLERGESARLFPALSETQKEGRTLSILLACMASVRELRETLLESADQRLGKRTKFHAFTEVVLKSDDEKERDRPDGLLIIEKQSGEWRALVEAKVGKAQLTSEQVERYVRLAKAHKIDAVITVSNQFTPTPKHHPCAPKQQLLKNVDLFHWSWSYVLSRAHLLSVREDVADDDQFYILKELSRFLAHPSAGVTSFTSMNPEWKTAVSTIRSEGKLQKSSDDAQHTIRAWHEESQDLALKLTMKLEVPVRVKISKRHRDEPKIRFQEDLAALCDDEQLVCEYEIPDAVDDMRVVANIRSRTIVVSMGLKAPLDRVSISARVNWLLRQFSTDDVGSFFISASWLGRAQSTQKSVEELLRDPKAIQADNPKLTPTKFEVRYVNECGQRFSGQRTFIEEVEKAAPHFYREVGQHLRPWMAQAPKVKEDESPLEDVANSVEGEEAT
jgi:hypothetical protein